MQNKNASYRKVRKQMARPLVQSVSEVHFSNKLEIRIVKNCEEISIVVNTLCPIKTCDYIFYNNFNNKCPIIIIFGIVSSQSRRHRNMVLFPTSPI